ncbi:MAG: hypothetical protein JO327_11525 [Nitrososphaeraceae archaeon]|nr:hypothetical protein [Nitrososphaeraceae archaeon]
MNTKTSIIIASATIAVVLVLFAAAPLITNPAFAYCSGTNWCWGYHGLDNHYGFEWDHKPGT